MCQMSGAEKAIHIIAKEVCMGMVEDGPTSIRFRGYDVFQDNN